MRSVRWVRVHAAIVLAASTLASMKARTFVPTKLDMMPFLESGEVISGDFPVTQLQRLASGLAQDVDLTGLPHITWSAQGRLVHQRAGSPQMWLDLHAQAELAWTCQRCLHPVTETIHIDRSIRFAKDEASAAALDAESDDDVLAMSRHFDLLALVEDELIMAQPIVPRHDVCPTDVVTLMHNDDVTPVPGTASAPAESPADTVATTASGRPNPFAVLATLKKAGS